MHTHAFTYAHAGSLSVVLFNNVMFHFHMPAHLQGKDSYADTFLWPCIASYSLSARQNFMVCHNVVLTN
jgi:hypothetical protein